MGYKIKRAEIHSIIMILKSKEGIFSNLTLYIYNVMILIRSYKKLNIYKNHFLTIKFLNHEQLHKDRNVLSRYTLFLWRKSIFR